jgi:hypothetical protein
LSDLKGKDIAGNGVINEALFYGLTLGAGAMLLCYIGKTNILYRNVGWFVYYSYF